MKNKRYTLILIIAIISSLLFTGCNTSIGEPSVMSPTIKAIYSNTLKELVSDKTITQIQSDKVIEEVKRNINDSKGCIDELNELVMSSVITKLQADIINNKIKLALKSILDK